MKIKQRQLFFFLACIAPVGKLILLPSDLVFRAKNDLLFPALVNLLLQAAVIFLVLLLCKREKSLYSLLEESVGRIAATVLVILLSLFLLYAAIQPLNEQKLMVQSVFYDTLPSLVVFSPFFLFAAYLCSKPLFCLGRVWDILGPIAIVSFIGIIVFAIGGADFKALQPVGAAGAKGFLNGTAFTMSWFFDSVLVLSLVGKDEYKKGLAWKGLLCYLAGAAAVLFFLAVFYAVYAELAVSRLFAFSKISRYFSGISVLGRIDYLFIYALGLVMAFYSVMPVQAAVDTLGDAFGHKKKLTPVLSTAFSVLFLVLAFLLNFQYQSMQKFISEYAFWIFPLFTLVLPPLVLLTRRKRRE